MTAKKYNYEVNGCKYYRHQETIEGKRCSFNGKSRAEALKKRDAYVKEILEAKESDLSLEFSEMKFGKLFEVWLYSVKKFDDIKPSSFARYDCAYRTHIKDSALSNMRVKEIKSIHLQNFVSKMLAKGASISLVRNTFKVIKMFVTYLVQEGALQRNICANVKLPRDISVKKDTINAFSDEEMKTVSKNLDSFWLSFFIKLAFASGMRKGEILALRYEDFRDGGVYVTKTLSGATIVDDADSRHREKTIWEPKSQSSIRFIPLPDEIFTNLKRHKAQQNAMCLENGFGRIEYVFFSPSGKLYDPTTVTKACGRFFEKIGIQGHTIHDARHTYITKLVESGVPIATVKELAGHSEISMTMHYVHIGQDAKILAVEKAKKSLLIESMMG